MSMILNKKMAADEMPKPTIPRGTVAKISESSSYIVKSKDMLFKAHDIHDEALKLLFDLQQVSTDKEFKDMVGGFIRGLEYRNKVIVDCINKLGMIPTVR